MAEQLQSHLGPDSQWATYEANVQSYRGLSLSAQSLFLAVGAILLGVGYKVPFFAVMVMALVSTWYIFLPAIFARTAIVDFHKFNFGQRFDGEGNAIQSPPTDGQGRLSERDYASFWHGRALRKRVYSHIQMPRSERFRTLRQTRLKLDVLMPILVSVVWLIFGVYILIVH